MENTKSQLPLQRDWEEHAVTQCELVKGLRVAESMVGLVRSGVPATLGFRKDKRPIHPFSTFFCAEHKQEGQCAPTWQPSASQATGSRGRPLQGQGQMWAPHCPIKLMHKLTCLPPLSGQSLSLGLCRKEATP